MSQEKVQIVAVNNLDFTSRETNEQVVGKKIYYCRPCYEYELGTWDKNVVCKTVFVREGSPVKVPKFTTFPCGAFFNYEPRGRYNVLVSVEIAND